MKFYTTEKIGPKQELTPEGFLLCLDVPIARTGVMQYGPGETPVPVGTNGIAYIDRSPEDVFRAETIASVNGKSVVDEHPDTDVSPENWRELSVGIVLNPRRGSGIWDDTLVVDMLITHKDAIPLIKAGKREVSAGYDADYDFDVMTPGKGRQKNIIMNHVALVDAGRCGPRCAIGDHATVIPTTRRKRMTLKERIRNAFKNKDEGALTAVLDEVPDKEESSGAVVIHNHIPVRDAKEDEDEDDDKKKKTEDAMDSRMKKVEDAVDSISKDVKEMKDRVMKDESEEEEEEEKKKKKETEDAEGNRKIEGSLEEEAPPGTADKARKARDSAYLEDSFSETVALAEIIAPGVGIPTFDKKAEPGKTYDNICKFRRSVLDLAYHQPETRSFMDDVLGGHELEKLPCGRVRDVFRAVGVFKKNANNHDTRSGSISDSNAPFGSGSQVTAADINKRNAEFYK